MSEDELRRADEALAALKAGLEARARTLQPNQCPACGAYRLDGEPPRIHEHGCPLADERRKGAQP